MADVIRLVCPECDAVHRVKSVTLGKLYRCKKCRSGLITMQPAILSCPNCGATTPPTHIEASRLITCEECEKAPLMEVRLPGVEYPKVVNSDVSENIASKMFVAVEEDSSGNSEIDPSGASKESEDSEISESVSEVVNTSYGEEDTTEDDLDENSIFKADTNFIVKSRANKSNDPVANPSANRSSLQQLEIFEQDSGEGELSSEGISVQEEPSSTLELSEEQQDEVIPDIGMVGDISHQNEHDSDEVFHESYDYQDELQDYHDEHKFADEKLVKDMPKKRLSWNWSLPAWVPAILALLLIGLYGILYADLDSMRMQLERSQENIISQDQGFQEERKKYISLIRSTQDEIRRLRSELQDLKSENDILRKKSVTFDIPELKED